MFENLDYLRYSLCNEFGLALSVLGFFVSLASLVISLCTEAKWFKHTCSIVIAISCLCSFALGVNYIDVKYISEIEYVEALDYCGLDYDLASALARSQKLVMVCNNGSSNTGKVTSQHNVMPGDMVKTNSIISVTVSEQTVEPVAPVTDASDYEDSDLPKGAVLYRYSDSDLSMTITDLQYFYNGYYYTYPDNDGNECFIDYKGKGLYGDVVWSRTLTETEAGSIYHGGELWDSNNNLIDEYNGNYPSYFLTADETGAHFACEFPEGLPAGNYTYVLRVIIDGNTFEYSFPIVVKA